jgi:hypothetical protein
MKIETNCQDYYSRTATRLNPRGGPVSKSLLFDFHKSPYKWLHGRNKEASKAMELGTLIHYAVLEPEKPLESLVAVSPYVDYRTKEAREWRDLQRVAGKIIATEEEVSIANACAEVFREDYAQKFAAETQNEVAVFGKIGETEVKGMIDIVPTGLDCLIDLKTTASIDSLDNLQRNIVNRGMHWQSALYLDLWNAASGEKRTRFVFCFMETDYPHETAWVELSENLIDIGRAGYMNAIAKWQTCVATDTWPKAVEGIAMIETPKWTIQ